ncbi:hypothetical protein PC123_g21727 [Phytophthora cactorum]|nr:hypothetical protein PC123_g21727 [Phytophthora cactorum]
MVQMHKIQEQARLTDARRAFAILDELCMQNRGRFAEVLVDSETNVDHIATLQTAKMKRLFRAFPDVIMIDSTHDTNTYRYKLFSFVAHNVFGKIFKDNNPEWDQIRVVATNKAVHDKDVLREMVPDARPLLCQKHVATLLMKQAARLAPAVKKDVKSVT